jgi:hypothetical protein
MQVAKNLAVHEDANLSIHGEPSLAGTAAAAIVTKLAFSEKEKISIASVHEIAGRRQYSM